MTPVLRASGVRKSFGSREVLRGIDLDVRSGECVVIRGPSGCGKSTLLHCLALLAVRDAGDVQCEGESTNAWTEKQCADYRAQRSGMVFQQFHVFPDRSVWQNILFRSRYTGAQPDIDRAEELLLNFGLSGHKNQVARTLSGGELQRVCIARAMLISPVMLFADEPTGNLDEENSAKVRDAISTVAQQGVGCLIATHDRAWDRLADRVFELRDGKLGPSRRS